MRKLDDMNNLPSKANTVSPPILENCKGSKDDSSTTGKKKETSSTWVDSVAEFFKITESTEEAASSAFNGVGLLTAAAVVRKIFFRV